MTRADRAARSTISTLVTRAGVRGAPAQFRATRRTPARTRAQRLSTSAGTGALVSVLSVPGGTAVLGNLGAHASPSCTGTSDGNRVQVVYAREAGTASRHAALLPSLQSFVADIDDTFALSSPDSGRRVRWVQDAACVPSVPEVVVPDGTLTGNGGVSALAASLAAAGFDRPDRKYLAFADAATLCGVGQMILDDSAAGTNANNGGIAAYARVDTPCWAARAEGHSTPAHELMHMLGGVQPSAPHATSFGHCTDEADAMCYADGPDATVTSTCTAAGSEAMFDCNRNDYFDAGGSAGLLAAAWNTATSSFLDVVAGTTVAPPIPASAPTSTATSPTRVSVTLAGPRRVYVGVAGRVSATVRSASGPVGTGVTLQTYTNATGWRTVASTTSSASGVAVFTVRSNTATLLPVRALVPATSAVAAARSAGWTISVVRRPTSTKGALKAGRLDLLTATVRTNSGTAVAGRYVTLQSRVAGSTSWRTVTRKLTNQSGQTAFAVRTRAGTTHRWVYLGAWNSAPSTSQALTGTR